MQMIRLENDFPATFS